MSLAVYTNRCMFFVGGNDYKSNSPAGVMLAGGCTKAWWDSQPNIDTVAGKQATMAKLMGADGEPIATVSTTSHSLYDIGGTNYVKVTDNVGTGFADAEVGMLVYHPDSTAMFVGGAGVFKVREVGGIGAGNTYIVLDTTWLFEGYPVGNDGDTVYVGGAWDELGDICTTYISAEYYTQEIWVNKDIAPTSQWDWSSWSGDLYNNTWLQIKGFHRVPGDITEPDGAYFQTAKSMRDYGVHADKLVKVDMGSLVGDLIDGSASENIALGGFYFTNASASIGVFTAATSAWKNIDISHVSIDLSYRLDLLQCRNFLLTDSNLANSLVFTDVTFNTDATSVVIFMNNYVRNGASTAAMNIAGIYFGIGNIVDIEGSATGFLALNGGFAFSMNNTFVDFDNSLAMGAYRCNSSSVIDSLNDIIFNKYADVYALEVAKFGGSYITKNLCAFSNAGQLAEVIYLHSAEPTGNIRKHDISDLLEMNPQFDANYEPLNESVRTGGLADILGDVTAIGAIKTMNTTVINTAVQAAMTSQGYTTVRAPYLDAIKAKTDNLPADPAGVSDLASIDVDTNSCKLAADGLDNVVVAEPSGDSAGWSLAQGLKWLIMRFKNKHTSDNFSGIVVHDIDGVVSTSQAVTEVDGVKSVGKVQ